MSKTAERKRTLNTILLAFQQQELIVDDNKMVDQRLRILEIKKSIIC